MLSIYLAALETDEERIRMAEIYEEHKYVAYRYALSIMQNEQYAEDAVHNAFLAIIRHKDKYLYLSHEDFRKSIVIITKNKCIDILRRNNRVAIEQIDEMEEFIASKETPVEKQVIHNEDYDAIKKYVAELDEESRLILEMKYILGLTYKEIGEQVGITAKHVDTKIDRARKKVRELVMKGGGNFEH